MIKKDFWSKSKIAVIGAGNFGTVLANLAAQTCSEVRVLVRAEEIARNINSTRTNAKYFPDLALSEKLKAFTQPERVFEEGVQAVIWSLPAVASRENAKELSRSFTGEEILIHATKGVEPGSLKRISSVLLEELPCPRVGVLSGPNLAAEIAKGEPAATIVASRYDEVINAGKALFSTPKFRVYGSRDVIGVEWAGTLKNVLAIAAGVLDSLGLGMNARAMLLSDGLAEMVRFGKAMGAQESTFLGLAGLGDMLATCSSPLSRNFRVGQRLGQGQKLDQILEELGSVAEGVKTTISVWEFAHAREVRLPITDGVHRLIQGQITAQDFVAALMRADFE